MHGLFLSNKEFTQQPSASAVRPRLPRISRVVLPALELRHGEVLWLAAIFWTFVTLTNLLYARSMQINANQLANVVMFAPWYVRVLQHLLLFGPLIGCFMVSLRIGWTPLWVRAPVQGALGAAFAGLAFAAMLIAESAVWKTVEHIPYLASRVAIPDADNESFGALWSASFAMFFMTYVFGIALVTGFALYRRFRDSEMRNVVLEQSFSKARLAALRMQLSPHTLFNLLHTIRGQINHQPEVARSMVIQFADLMRRLLDASQRDFCTLEDELNFVRLYLDLQQQRFADRMVFRLPADLPQDIWVPSLILQPLVENAVVHGVADREGLVSIEVAVAVSGPTLSLTVTNTIARDSTRGPDGIGLPNVRERLRMQFEADGLLLAGPTDGCEWRTQVTMPILRELSLPSAAAAPASAPPLTPKPQSARWT